MLSPYILSFREGVVLPLSPALLLPLMVASLHHDISVLAHLQMTSFVPHFKNTNSMTVR